MCVAVCAVVTSVEHRTASLIPLHLPVGCWAVRALGVRHAARMGLEKWCVFSCRCLKVLGLRLVYVDLSARAYSSSIMRRPLRIT
jgi:hypothetical protein